jgi:signal-transduction protein with cAMP-binding, CBS, and nucleotidyltransferase domain
MPARTEGKVRQMTVTDSILRGVPLFTGMTDRALEAVGDLVSERRFETDEDLVRQGDSGDSFLILRDGTASVLLDDRPVHELGALTARIRRSESSPIA